MRQFSRKSGCNLLARVLVLGSCLCAAQSMAQPAQQAPLVATLEGQRAFLQTSIAWCAERVPALKAELAEARAHAEPQIRAAERLIGEQVGATAGGFRAAVFAQFNDLWKKNAAALMESLKRQNAEAACVTLRNSWLAMEAEVIIEDWQNYLDRQLADDEAGPQVQGE